MDVNGEKRNNIDDNNVPTPSEVGVGSNAERRRVDSDDLSLENMNIAMQGNSDVWIIKRTIAKIRKIYRNQ